jgi:hypothetical protein
MSIGGSVSIVSVGAILAIALHVSTPGFSWPAVGLILIAVGVVSLVLQLSALARQRDLVVEQAARTVVVRPPVQPVPVARFAEDEQDLYSDGT